MGTERTADQPLKGTRLKMQPNFLYHLAWHLRYLIVYAEQILKTLKQCMDRSGTEDELLRSITEIRDEIEYTIVDTWKDNKKVDKEVERGMKHGLYRLEILLNEIIAFEKEGHHRHPGSILESFISSGSEELKLIVDELKPYSGNNHHWLVTKSVGCREYKLETEKLIELLLNPNAEMVVYILGKPGVGKSTLLGLACNDSRIQNHFVETNNIDYMNDPIYSAESLLDVMDEADPRGKRLLITIDNVDPDIFSFFSANRYKSLYKGLMKRAGQGSKIVITSRLEIEEVAGAQSAQRPSPIFRLSGLSPSESWNLFKRTAFPENMEKRLQTTLSDIGHQICEKCKNVPSVIVTIATILSFKTTPEEWTHFLDVVMTSVPDPITTITHVLNYTVQENSSLQDEWYFSFAWCSLLPKDYTFTKEGLIHLWTTHYMYKWNKNAEQVQKGVELCFNDFLQSGCLLKSDGIGSTVSYKISSLGYELMKHLAGDDYCLVDSPAVEIHHKVIRHISFIVDASWEPPPSLSQADLLQSIWFWPRKSGDFISLSKINSMLSRMEHLCALHAEIVHCERIPQFLGKFKKLKYLRLGGVSTISLPYDVALLEKLLNSDPYYTSLIDDNCRRAQVITSLLVRFTSRKLSIQPEKDNGMDSLEEARHFMKSLNIQSIILSSNHGDDEILKSSNLHQTLESLKVLSWTGEKWPTEKLTNLTYNLVSLQFGNCKRCRQLPAFSRLPHLSFLQLGGMCSLEDILTIDENSEASSTRFYPSLETLLLLDLPLFKGWSHKEGNYFPLLAQVRVQGCPNLMSMPTAPMLKSLEAININAELINHLIYPHESTLSSTSSTPSLVTNLELDGCIDFDWADKQIWLSFSCLRSLKLNNIIQIVSLPDGLDYITTLEQLSLCWLTNLKALPQWITKLRRLTIHYCLKLTTIPNSFSGLEQLYIRYCPRLSQFPESLPNLKRLRVQEICRFEQILRASQNLVELEIDNCQDWDYDKQSTEGNSSVQVCKGHNNLRSFKMTKMEAFPKSIDFEQLSELSHLTIHSCPKMATLPELLCSLSSLEYLHIKSCPGLTQLPSAFNNLRSLKQLEIRMSPELEKRCKAQSGEDWHLIQHITNVICGKQ